MIEVEIKCQPTPEQKAALLKDATFLGEEITTDIYYDLTNYALAAKDIWLRTRNGKFILKKPAEEKVSKHELEDEQEIRAELNLSPGGTLEEALRQAGYNPFFTFSKHRKKYTKEGIVIDLDCAEIEDVTLDLFCEFELMVEKPQQVEKATQKLINFAQRYGITIKEPVKADIMTFIKTVKPELFAVLQKAREQNKNI